MTKVAFLSFDYGEYSVRLASALAENASVLLLLPEGLADSYLPQLDPRVVLQTFPRIRLREPMAQMRRNRWIHRQLRDFRADVLHLQQGSMWFNLSLSSGLPYPVVLTVHDAEPHVGDKLSQKTPYFFWKLGFRKADQIITHSYYVRDMLRARLTIPSRLLHVIPHLQVGGAVESPHHVPDDGKTILFFGRIWPYKGLDVLINAERWMAAQAQDYKIIIAGEGEDFGRYRQMMMNPDRFEVINRHISEAEANLLFRRASVVVLPYIEASQSGVIPVAYTYRKPVIASNVGGLPEMVDDGVTGLLVPPRDEKQLAAAIVKLLKDKELRFRMGAAGERKLEHECGAAVVAHRTLEVYRIASLEHRRRTLERPRARVYSP
jgi:glycosyltransferase involved in cell wall biosynthesis